MLEKLKVQIPIWQGLQESCQIRDYIKRDMVFKVSEVSDIKRWHKIDRKASTVTDKCNKIASQDMIVMSPRWFDVSTGLLSTGKLRLFQIIR